jgi:hypothetical protein
LDLQVNFPQISQDINGGKILQVWDYWTLQKGAAIAPTWNSFELIDIYASARICLVMDVEDHGETKRLKYRYVGTEIVKNRWNLEKPDHTGLYFDDVTHQYDFSKVKDMYDQCIETLQPLHISGRFEALDAVGIHERLVLPLITSTGRIDKIICALERLEQTALKPNPNPSSV